MPATVLLVDADPDSRFVFGAALKHSGYEVRETGNGSDAIDAALIGAPDIIVLELLLPSIAGPELIAALRELPQTAGVPLVVASAQPASRNAAAVGMADAYLAKPCRPWDLVSTVEGLLGRPRALVT